METICSLSVLSDSTTSYFPALSEHDILFLVQFICYGFRESMSRVSTHFSEILALRNYLAIACVELRLRRPQLSRNAAQFEMLCLIIRVADQNISPLRARTIPALLSPQPLPPY
jgi:hypothetical protein